MTYLTNRLSIPDAVDPSMWIDEAIWGHRLHDEQSPWLVFLEFLNIYCHEHENKRGLEEPLPLNSLKYKLPHRYELRNILYNSPEIEAIRKEQSDDSAQWGAWISRIQHREQRDVNYEYLKQRFNYFSDFAEVVALLRSTSLEMNSNKRWTSKFVFPYGPACLYPDVDKNFASDRLFFARTGELVYLMLCRSARNAELKRELLGSYCLCEERPKLERYRWESAAADA